MILHVFSSEEAIKASSCSNGAIKARLEGARLRFAKVKAASFDIFSSLVVRDPVAISPIRRSMHLYCDAMRTFRAEAVSLSEIVQRISRQPSRVSMFGLTSRFTRFCMSESFRVSRYLSLPAERLSLLIHSMH